MTIHATKADVDQAQQALEDGLADLADRALRWRDDINNPQQPKALRAVQERVERHAETYDNALKAWAAGPSGDERG